MKQNSYELNNVEATALIDSMHYEGATSNMIKYKVCKQFGKSEVFVDKRIKLLDDLKIEQEELEEKRKAVELARLKEIQEQNKTNIIEPPKRSDDDDDLEF